MQTLQTMYEAEFYLNSSNSFNNNVTSPNTRSIKTKEKVLIIMNILKPISIQHVLVHSQTLD